MSAGSHIREKMLYWVTFCLCQVCYLTLAEETDLCTKFSHNPQRIRQEASTKRSSFVLLSDAVPGLMSAAHHLNLPLYVQIWNIATLSDLWDSPLKPNSHSEQYVSEQVSESVSESSAALQWWPQVQIRTVWSYRGKTANSKKKKMNCDSFGFPYISQHHTHFLFKQQPKTCKAK